MDIIRWNGIEENGEVGEMVTRTRDDVALTVDCHYTATFARPH